jgi:hypothetical protein
MTHLYAKGQWWEPYKWIGCFEETKEYPETSERISAGVISNDSTEQREMWA